MFPKLDRPVLEISSSIMHGDSPAPGESPLSTLSKATDRVSAQIANNVYNYYLCGHKQKSRQAMATPPGSVRQSKAGASLDQLNLFLDAEHVLEAFAEVGVESSHAHC